MTRKIIIAFIVLSAAVVAGSILYSKISGSKLSSVNTQVSPSTAPSQTPQPTPEIVKPSGKTNLTLTDKGFIPQTTTIKKGNIVVWLNKSGKEASIAPAPDETHQNYPPLNLGKFQDGATMSIVFYTTGKYRYNNPLNPTQAGEIVVEN